MKHGGKRPGAGRPAGSQNADTAAMRAALSGLLEGQVAAWIQTSSATVDLKAAISSARASAGLGSSFKCNTQSHLGIGCCDGHTKQAPQQRGTWRDISRA